jgi:enediyne biosynthesis protein E4
MRRLVLAGFCLGLLGLGLLAWACRQTPSTDPAPETARETPPEPPLFEDVTEKLGLHFIHDPGPTETYFMPQQVGSGAALFDFDNDGRLDIYLLQNAGPGSGVTNRLFHQLPDGHFQDVSAGSGLDIDGYNMGVAIGDVNNDGLPDVLVTQYDAIRLFLNLGNGKFREVTREARLDNNPGWATSAAFVDYDRDGWLDLVVVNYVAYDPTWPCSGRTNKRDYCAPKNFQGRASRLFHNRGRDAAGDKVDGLPVPAVRFDDMTDYSGLGQVIGPGLGVLCADFDGDGWPDIFIANDGAANHLWINQKNGKFREEAVQRNVALDGMGRTQAGMGIAYGDVYGDGLPALYVTHLSEEGNNLWRQGPRGNFQDRTRGAGLSDTAWKGTGFGVVLADFTNHGALDIAVANGQVAKLADVKDWSLGPFWSQYGDRNQIFRNEGKGHFRDVSRDNAPFCGSVNVARGLAQGDFDGDGGVDLLLTTIGGPARLFRNMAPDRGHWLQVRAFDPALKRDALGAEVRVRAGQRTWLRWICPAESYVCSSEPRAHFGLDSATEVDAIDVVWPDGSRETFPGCAVDQRLELRKGQGRATAGK